MATKERRRNPISRARVLVACELLGFGLVTAAGWLALGVTGGLLIAGACLLVIANSKGR